MLATFENTLTLCNIHCWTPQIPLLCRINRTIYRQSISLWSAVILPARFSKYGLARFKELARHYRHIYSWKGTLFTLFRTPTTSRQNIKRFSADIPPFQRYRVLSTMEVPVSRKVLPLDTYTYFHLLHIKIATTHKLSIKALFFGSSTAQQQRAKWKELWIVWTVFSIYRVMNVYIQKNKKRHD